MAEEMGRSGLQIEYDGPALKTGRMDVRDLAPALLAISSLCNDAFRLLNGENAQIRVEVQADFKKGSFGVTMDLAGLWDQMRDLFSGKGAAAIVFMLSILGFQGAPKLGMSLLQLVKSLRGKRPAKVSRGANGMVRVELDGDVFLVSEEVIRLYYDVHVRHSLAVALAPLTKPGIETFAASAADQKPIVMVTKDEVHWFAPPSLSEEPETLLLDRTEQRAFELPMVPLKDNSKWRLSDGESTIYAQMEDSKFLQRMDAHTETFIKGDILVCQIRLKQFQTAVGIRNEYTVLEVLDHRHPPVQNNMDFDPAE